MKKKNSKEKGKSIVVALGVTDLRPASKLSKELGADCIVSVATKMTGSVYFETGRNRTIMEYELQNIVAKYDSVYLLEGSNGMLLRNVKLCDIPVPVPKVAPKTEKNGINFCKISA